MPLPPPPASRRFRASAASGSAPNRKASRWNELREIASGEEIEAMASSSKNAHFTYDLYQPIWDALERHGFTGGRVLEPAVGTGHAPRTWAGR